MRPRYNVIYRGLLFYKGDDTMPLKYTEVIKEVSLERILRLIAREKNFQWTYAAIKVTEPENNVRFDVFASKDLSDKKNKEWGFVESLYAKDKYEARRHRRMKRYPEHNYGVIINITNEEGKTAVRIHYLYDDKNAKIADLSMKMKVVEDYLTYKEFETVEDVVTAVEKQEEDDDREFMMMKKVQEIKNKYYNKR